MIVTKKKQAVDEVVYVSVGKFSASSW